jgi:transposase
MRRAWLRGRENIHKRYLVHVAGYNLGLIMRLLTGTGTPREFAAGISAHPMLFATAANTAVGILIIVAGTEAATLVITVELEPHG